VAYLGDQDDGFDASAATNPATSQVAGGDGGDTLTGSPQFDELLGDGPNSGQEGSIYEYDPSGDGDDTINGGGGGATIYGGAGGDTVVGGAGFDFLAYSNRTQPGTKPVVADPDGAVADDGEDSDGDGQADEGDSIGTGVEGVGGGSGDDRLRAAAATESLSGNGGDDVLDGGLAAVAATSFFGGQGDDAVSYASRPGTGRLVVRLDDINEDGTDGDGDGVGEENDDVKADVESVIGGGGDDLLVGDEPDPSPGTDDGNDRLDGRGGADVLQGLGGVDRAVYSTRTAGEALVADPDGVADDGTPGLDGPSTGTRDDIRPDVEGIEGGAGADRLVGDGGANQLDGGGGDDRLVGTAGADRLLGRAGTDLLDGGIGPDSISGGQGAADRTTYASRLSSQPVTVDVDSSADDGGSADANGDRVTTDVEQLVGGSGADTLTGSTAANHLDGGPGGDRLFGAAGADSLLGRAGNDLLDGGGGPDDMSGGSDGGDRASYATRTAPVTVDLDASADDGGSADGRADRVRPDIEQLAGGSRGDALTGSSAANILDGGLGADTLLGLGGSDSLLARDGVSDTRVDCGGGVDLARLDRLPRDPVSRIAGCESAPRG
jgi:Ca2+-binding RTX toxin-like protein